MCGNQNYREFGTAFTEGAYPTTTCCCGCPSCSITKHLIINIFRENLFWFKASQSTLLESHCDGRNVRQLITLHQLSGSTEKQMLPFGSLWPLYSVKNLSPLDGIAQTQNCSSHLSQHSLKCPHRQ